MSKTNSTIASIFIFFSIVCVVLVGLLFFEYRSLMHYRCRLKVLKGEYRTHVNEVKQLIRDYQQTKYRLTQLEAMLEGKEYASEVLDAVASSTVFDEYMKVFSSAIEDTMEQESFITINRDLEYLKQQSQEYIKKQNLELLFKRMPEDIWQDYIDTAAIKKTSPKKAQPKRSFTKKRIMHSATSALSHKDRNDVFSWPVKRSSFWLSSLFGRRKNADGSQGFHNGIDMAALKGTPVCAAAAGVVVEARNARRGYGKTIVIKHTNKYKTRYAHLNALYVRVGQKVHRGMRIGDVGDTGFVRKSGKDASHLHFELYVFGERVNPLYYLA